MNKWLEDISVFSNLDCGDSSCKYKARGTGGMRTNGGCRCHRNHPQDVERFLLRNYHKALLKVQQLEATLEVDKILEK
jgi:hypothetical protein